MPNLSLKNVPRDLHRKLKERARRNHRSLNAEILSALEQAIAPRRIDPDEAAARIRALRARFAGPPPSDDDLARQKGEGRP